MRLAAAVLLTTLAIAGCSSADAPPHSSDDQQAREQDPWGPLAVQPPQEGFLEAETGGTLRITDECVFLGDGDESEVLLVWPADRTSWDGANRTITYEDVDGTVTVADGDQVTLGGGYVPIESFEEWVAEFEWVSPPAQTCRADLYWPVGAYMGQGLDPS